MKRKRDLLVQYAVPCIIVAGGIVFLSSQRNIQTRLSIPDPILKSIAHFCEYFLLTLVTFRFMKEITRKNVLFSVLFIMLFGLTDEIHQSIVPTRTPDVFDLLVDYIALLVGIVTSQLILRWKRHHHLPTYKE